MHGVCGVLACAKRPGDWRDDEGDLWLLRDRRKKELFFFNTITEEIKTFEEKFGANPPFRKTDFITAIQLANKSIIISLKQGQLMVLHPDGTTKDIQFVYKSDEGERNLFPFKIDPKKITIDLCFRPGSNQFWVHLKHSGQELTRDLLFYDEHQNLKSSFKKPSGHFTIVGVRSNNELAFRVSEKTIFQLTPDGVWSERYLGEFHSVQSITNYTFLEAPNEVLIFQNGKGKLIDLSNFETLFETAHHPELEIVGVISLLVDKGIYWVGTRNGLLKVQLQQHHFTKSLYKDPSFFPNTQFLSMRGIVESPDGKILASSKGFIYDVKTEEVVFGEENLRHSYDIFYDKKGNRWFNSSSRYHSKLNLQTNQEERITFLGGKHTYGWDYYEDDYGRIWVGTYAGLQYYEEGFSEMKQYIPIEEFKFLRDHIVYHFFEDQSGRILLATTAGLFELDIEKGIMQRFWKGGKGKNYLPTNIIRHLHQDEEGIFWIVTLEGLIRWDEKKGTSQLFTTADGLANNILSGIYEDEFGFLWMSSDNGIIQFQKETFKVKNHFTSDGISDPEFNRSSHCQATDGTIYFGGMNGITYFHPRDFVDDFDLPVDIPLVMTECQFFSKKNGKQESRLEDFYKKNKITLTPDDRYLTLQFALLDYHHFNAAQYVYTIDDEQWNPTKENTLNISSLPYGKHSLVVKVRTGNGLFSKNTLTIPIEVLKPYYLQWWFIALGVLAVIVGVVFYQKLKTRRLLQRQKELEQNVQERTRTIQNQSKKLQFQAEELIELNKTKSKFMANISHELRTPLTLILNTMERGEVNDSKDSKTFTYDNFDVKIVQRNAHRLQQLIEQLLDLSKLEAGKMSLKSNQGDFYKYLQELTLSFQPLAENKNIQLSFFSELDDCELYFDRDKMDKVIYNLLGNALKFSPKGANVDVMLFKEKNEVIFKIKDTGIGIPEKDLPLVFDRFYRGEFKDEYAYEGTGLGLALVKDFVEIHSGKIEVKSQIGKGTTFTIYLPLGNVHLQSNEIIPTTEDKIILQNQPIVGSQLEDNLIPTNDEEAPILLIIEDNEDLLYHHQQIFQNDYQLLLARDGQEGIEMAVEHLPDVIVCDVMMPKRNGYEVCQILKLDEKTNHIPVILLTAKADQKEKLEGLMVGADEYLTKPYDQKELDVRLKNLLTHQKLIREKFNLQVDYSIPETKVKTPQQQFIEQCKSIVETNFSNPNFGVEEWSNELHMSRSQLFRKVKTIMGTTPMHFLRTYRLEKAKELLNQFVGNGSEVAYMVGFNNPNYFFKCFKDEYGMTVGTFMKA